MDTAKNHLLVTETLAMKGQVANVVGRLADHLGNYERPTLRVEDTETTFFTTFDRVGAAIAEVSRAHILFAHEYVAMSGDPHLQAMDEAQAQDRYRIVVAGAPGLSLTACLKNERTQWERRFLVLAEPEIEDVGGCPAGMADSLEGLPYLLVNRERVETIFRV